MLYSLEKVWLDVLTSALKGGMLYSDAKEAADKAVTTYAGRFS